MSIIIDDVIDALRLEKVDTALISAVTKRIVAIEQEKKEEKAENPAPKQKSQFVVFVMDDGTLTGKDLIGYVTQIPADKSPTYAKDAFIDSVRGYNNGCRKGRKFPVKKVGDGMTTIKGKWLKESKLKIKTKEAVLVIPMKNDIENPTKEVVSND